MKWILDNLFYAIDFIYFAIGVTILISSFLLYVTTYIKDFNILTKYILRILCGMIVVFDIFYNPHLMLFLITSSYKVFINFTFWVVTFGISFIIIEINLYDKPIKIKILSILIVAYCFWSGYFFLKLEVQELFYKEI